MGLCFDVWVLAPIGLVKGLILGSLNAIAVTCAFTLILCLFFPWNFFLAAKVLWTTAYLGPNVRLLLLLFLPLIGVIVGVATPIGAFLCAFFYSVFAIAATVVSNTGDCTTIDVFTHTWKDGVWEFYEYELRAGEDAANMCNIPMGWQGQVYEIPLVKAIIGAGIVVFGTLFGVLLIPCLTVLKIPTGYFWANKFYIKEAFKKLSSAYKAWIFILIIVLGWCLMNALALPAIFLIGAPLYSLTIGMQSALVALKLHVISEGFRETFRLIRIYDQRSTFLLVLNQPQTGSSEELPSLIPRMRERVSLAHDTPEAKGGIQDSFEAIFAAYVRQAHADTTVALNSSWIKAAHVQDLEPYLMVGIPALALFSVLVRSAASAPGRRELVCERPLTSVVTEASKPNHGIVKQFWPKLMQAKIAIEHIQLSETEIQWCRIQLLTNGAADDEKTHVATVLCAEGEDGLRRKLIMCEVISRLTSLAIDCSRLGNAKLLFAALQKPGEGAVEVAVST